jgi:hypothetical protein
MHASFKRHPDAFRSSIQCLLECSDVDSYSVAFAQIRRVDNVVIVMKQLVRTMQDSVYPVKISRVSECVVDSTHGTNSTGFEMFAMIVPFRGEGYPLSYFFIRESGMLYTYIS